MASASRKLRQAATSQTSQRGKSSKARKPVLILDTCPTDTGEPDELLVEYLEEAGFDINDLVFSSVFDYHIEKPGKTALRKNTFFAEEMKRIKPGFVLLVGNTALQAAMGKTGIKKFRGIPEEIDGVIYLPCFSPAYVGYDERQAPILKMDINNFHLIVQGGKIPKEEGLDIVTVLDRKTFKRMLNDLEGIVSYDIETTGLYPWAFDAEITALGFGTANHQWVIPLLHHEVDWDAGEIDWMIDQLDEHFAQGDVKLVMQNGKFDLLWSRVKYNVRWKNHFDTMLAHYLLDENMQHDLKYLSKIYFNAPDYDVPLEVKQYRGPLEKCVEYQAADLYYTRKLYFRLKRELKADPGLWQVFEHILMPVANIFVGVEHRGVFVDHKRFGEAEAHLRAKIAEAEKELAKHASINWGSPKQVGDLLYNKLKLPIKERTKKGSPSAGESALKQIDHPLVAALLKYRGAKQQLSFFIEGWKPYLVKNRLHPSFKLHGTVTGRLSCENPNLQQVPRDPLIRSLITAPPGYTLLEIDLSQIELRIAGHMADERNLLHAFDTGVDAHWLTMTREMGRAGSNPKLVKETASTLVQRKVTNYGEALEIVFEAGPDACAEINSTWKELRKKAKAINFGYLFGMWWKKFIQYARDNYDVSVTEEEAQASRESFFDLYPGFVEWHKAQRRFAGRHGYVRSLSGRKRRLPEAMSNRDTPQKQEALRQSINSPVQSFANDLNLMALIEICEHYQAPIIYPVGTVHDACLIEVRNDYLVEVTKKMLEIMEGPALLKKLNIHLKVGIEGEAKVGPWSKGVSIKKWEALNAA
jgi:DNA polymerase I-like protein with 3'-5' exonuclease and polymerase domains